VQPKDAAAGSTLQHAQVSEEPVPRATTANSAGALGHYDGEPITTNGLSQDQVALLKKAVALAKSNPHCRKVEDAVYQPIDELTGKPVLAPFFVTCTVDNPAITNESGGKEGYAKYFFTKDQIESGTPDPFSTVGDLPEWTAEEQRGKIM
jgi:hypothetical protein